MSFLKEIPVKYQAAVSAVLQIVDLPLEAKLEMLRTMKLEESVISKAADHLRRDFRLLLTEPWREVVNLLLKQEDWSNLKKVIRGESTEIQAAYTAFLEKVAANGGRVPADPSEPAEGSSSSSNRPKEAQNSGQKNQGNEAKAEKKSRFFDGFPEEMNIFLLGEDGSGKDEFINSFANYLKYENFDEALKNGPKVVIPTDSISLVQDLNSAEMTYIPAEAEQTQLSRKRKKAQESKVYSFTAEGAQKSLRFIDTPDLPDQEDRHWSIERDKHLTNVLELVQNFGQIHAILIFVRSDTKHTDSYRRYLAKAFHHLHYQAAKNIIFCFTSIAKTSYRPRESAIKDFADWPFNFKAGHEVRPAENITYCFENDSYRILCAQKEEVPLRENVISVGRKHWTLSVQETFRLLGHLKTLTPFSNSTLNTIFELITVLSDFFVSRIVQRVVDDEEIQKLEKRFTQLFYTGEDLRTLKEQSDEYKRSFPKLVDFCVEMDTYFQQNVLAYGDLFDVYSSHLLQEKVTNEEVKLDPSTETMVRTYFEREMKQFRKEKESYMNILQKNGSRTEFEEISAKELTEPYSEEWKEWQRILTKKQVLSRPHSAELIKIENDWYCNSHIWK